jgi:predicted hotdog family 3-hydroxylacyl-ACP dehydratase
MIENIPIEDLIPHRGDMRLIDVIVAVDDNHAETQARAKADWPLIAVKGAGPLLLIELAAQTAGVCFGYNEMNKPVDQRKEAGGWLVGVKKARFFIEEIVIGTCITIRTETSLMVDQYKEIAATASFGESLMAEIHLQVLQADQVL